MPTFSKNKKTICLPIYRFNQLHRLFKSLVVFPFLFIFPIVLFCFLESFAQSKPLFFNHLKVRDGLSQGVNNFIYTDTKGFVWISSLNGLNRFDGKNVVIYKPQLQDKLSLPDGNIQSQFFEDKKTNIWFSTHAGLVCYNRKLDGFHSFLYKNKQKTHFDYMLAFMDKEESLWIVVEKNKLFRVKHEHQELHWEFQLDLPRTHRLMPLFTPDSLIAGIAGFYYDKLGFYVFNIDENNKFSKKVYGNGENGQPALQVTGLLPERDSLLWIATEEHLCLLNLYNEKYEFFPLPKGNAKHLTTFQNNQILVASDGAGLFVFDKKDRKFTQHYSHQPDVPSSLATDAVMAVFQDRMGTIWADIKGAGVDFAHPNKIKFNSLNIQEKWPHPIPTDGIYSLALDANHHVWASSRQMGLFQLDTTGNILKHFYNTNQQKVLPNNDIFYSFFDSKNRGWAFSYSGLGLKMPNDQAFNPAFAPEVFIYGIETKERDIFLANREGGLFRVIENSQNIEVKPVTLIPQNAVFTNLFQNERGWLYACQHLEEIWIMDTQNNFNIIKKLDIKGDVNTFFEQPDKDLIWIGLNNGLVRLNQNDFEWTLITEADGLPDQNVLAIFDDKKGNFWLSTNRGIVRYSQEEEIHGFDLPDGLQALEFNRFGGLQLTNGKIWFAGKKGINIFHPDSIQKLTHPPQLQFTKLWINDEERAFFEGNIQNITELEELILPYQENTLSLEFAALEYSNPGGNTFQYKMENYDEKWLKGKKVGFARYANMPPGKYIFKAAAKNSDGILGTEKKLNINILRPFWEEWWFYLLCLLLIAGIFYSIYRFQLNEYKKRQILRNNISKNLHDDIGSNLSHINILTTLLKTNLPQNPNFLDLIQRIEEEVKFSAEALDDIIFNVNPKYDSLELILARMRWFANDVFEAQNINGIIEFPMNVSHIHLDMNKRQDFYFLFREGVNNLAKYAQCNNVKIELFIEQKKLYLIIEDDGVGFDMNKLSRPGNGLENMKSRAKKLNGTLNITSQPGKGTRLELQFKINS